MFSKVASSSSVAMQLFNIAVVSKNLLQLALCCICVSWCRSCPRLQFVNFCGWILYYLTIGTSIVLYFDLFEECPLDCCIEFALFFFTTTAHVIVLFNAFMQRQQQHQLHELMQPTTTTSASAQWLQQKPKSNVHRYIACIMLLIAVIHGLVIWISLRLGELFDMPLFWISMPSSLALQLKLVGFIVDVLTINEHVACLRNKLKLLAMRAKPAATVWQQVIQLKQHYSQLYQQFQQLNAFYGASMLIVFIVLFFDFVFNAYWMLKHILTRPSNCDMIFHHLCFVIYYGLLLSLTCWYCQQSYNLSRQIGCLISKLIKPLASKRYNDLISEFLLQTLHQRFVLTAKDFFNLNLHLLSSMFAAVVTYLVILIQFMFAEKGSQSYTQQRVESALNLKEMIVSN